MPPGAARRDDVARYQLTRPYFGPTATSAAHTMHPTGEIIEMPDTAQASLYWLALDVAAEQAIAAEQQRQVNLRKGWSDPASWSAWLPCMPHLDGPPPLQNWPVSAEPQQQGTSRSWPPRSRLARHNRG
jgi:hypothetical protein